MEAYFGVLHYCTPLSIFDPGVVQIAGENVACKNPLDWLEQTTQQGNEIDRRSVRVRRMLQTAMYDHFYKWYHPREAYKR
jgi:hypothetical protein